MTVGLLSLSPFKAIKDVFEASSVPSLSFLVGEILDKMSREVMLGEEDSNRGRCKIKIVDNYRSSFQGRQRLNVVITQIKCGVE